MKHPLLSLLLIFISGNLMAQTSITGQITDTNGEALTGANVYIEGTYEGTTSNGEGKFQLNSTETGEQVLRIEFIGFNSYKKTLNLAGTSIDLSHIALKEELNELTAVTITAGTFEAGDKKKSISLSSIDMVTTDGSSGDVYGALQALPVSYRCRRTSVRAESRPPSPAARAVRICERMSAAAESLPSKRRQLRPPKPLPSRMFPTGESPGC